ncbi:hypothetical protein JH67_02980 [Listeria monocytogenes]|nr:hypothetical protein [Listeria monocytogenes]
MDLNKVKVICDECGNEFRPKFKKKNRAKGIVINYFECPKCNHKYLGAATDQRIRRDQLEIKKMQKLFAEKAGVMPETETIATQQQIELQALDKQINKKAAEIKVKIESLKQTIKL